MARPAGARLKRRSRSIANSGRSTTTVGLPTWAAPWALPLAPRLARMVVEAAGHGEARRAAELAMLLSERGLGSADAGLSHRLERVRAKTQAGARRPTARGQWARQAMAAADRSPPPSPPRLRGRGSDPALLSRIADH
jgi:hypothetical protein